MVISVKLFPAFRVAFEPGLVKWDVDPEPLIRRASSIYRGGAKFCSISTTKHGWRFVCGENLDVRVVSRSTKTGKHTHERVGLSLVCGNFILFGDFSTRSWERYCTLTGSIFTVLLFALRWGLKSLLLYSVCF